MHFSTTLAAVAAVAPLVSAHGGAPVPKIFGLNPRELRARNLLDRLDARAAAVNVEHAHEKRAVTKRQGGTDGMCGAGLAKCDAGYCCSPEGYCGIGDDYCYSPGCQYAYGPGCPENKTPCGTSTSSIPRPKLGSVQYGGDGIYQCVTPGTVAITYDDGPLQNLTDHILDLFDKYNGKATFFITGNNINKGEIDTTPELSAAIKRAYDSGHHIASHTWTHLDLSAISQADRKDQMYKNEMALRNILGVIPTYMRPPYSSCTGQCETDMADLGYHVTYFNVDTDDYDQDAPNLIQKSKDWFKGNITAGGAQAASSEWLSISHDIHVQTAYNLTEYMLTTLQSLGYRSVTVGECLGDDKANWYRAASGAASGCASTNPSASQTSSAPVATATKVSTDGTCGGTGGLTCLGSTFGNCCSGAGWCGSTSDYCGDGCQAGAGNCGSNTVSSVTKAASIAASSATVKAVSSTKASSAAAPASTLKVSTDATCGGTTKFTCQGSTFGNCCSANGWCGSTADYCGTGCQGAFGTCTSSGASSVKASAQAATSTKAPAASATPASKVSTDGTCGGTTKYTCKSSSFGNCCSQYGWCGSDAGHCGTGCNKAFGTCTDSTTGTTQGSESGDNGNNGNNNNNNNENNNNTNNNQSSGILGWWQQTTCSLFRLNCN